jgi:hypothetical protein
MDIKKIMGSKKSMISGIEFLETILTMLNSNINDIHNPCLSRLKTIPKDGNEKLFELFYDLRNNYNTIMCAIHNLKISTIKMNNPLFEDHYIKLYNDIMLLSKNQTRFEHLVALVESGI